MPLFYAPIKLKASRLKAMDEASEMTEQITILRDQISEIVDFLNVELGRNANVLNSAGGEKASFRVASADTMVSSTDRTIAFDTTAGDVTATLPLAAEYPGLTVCGKEVAGANVAAFGPRGSDTINGVAAVFAITSTATWLQADAVNNNWVVI